jgi:hypothetical protein
MPSMTMPIFLRGLFVALPLAAAGPALAQGSTAAATTDPDEIIVQHGRPADVTRGQVQRQARDITPSGDHFDIPLARFEDRLCPGIIGLQVDAAMTMIDRIRYNAHQLGVRIQDDGCTPNLLVVFSTDSQASMQDLVDSNPWVFSHVREPEQRRMLAPGPVHVFTQIEPRTRDGMPIGQARDLTAPPVSHQAMAHSILYTSTRRDIVGATIIFDRDEIGGMTVGQLADYVTMRGLAQTQPPTDIAMNSILSLFNPTGPYPEGLTDFDRAYLRALYDWIPNLPAAAKLANVNEELNRIAEEAAQLAAAEPARP